MRVVFCILLCFIQLFCFAQIKTAFPAFKLKEITQREKLSDPYTISITQDKDGLMWVGTNTGLNRLDGYTVKTFFYNPTKADGLSNNTIMDLNVNFNNKCWISTGNGICYYDYDTKKIKRINSDTDKVLYATLIPAKDRLLAISEIDGKWYAVDKNNKLTNLHFKMNYDTIGEQIKKGIPFSNKKDDLHYWTFTGTCLVNINLNTLKIQDAINLGEIFKTHHLHSILEDGNYLWISTWGRGLLRYNLLTKELIYLKSKNTYFKQTVKFKDANNKYWIVSANQNGYSIVDPTTLELKDYLLGADTYKVCVDKQNTIWFGTANGLFYAENKKEFIQIKQVFDNYISPNEINELKETLPWNLYSTSEYYFIPLTNEKAMLQFDKNWRFIKYFESNKNRGKQGVLAYENITGIYEKDNFYWVITYTGLVKCKKDFTPIKWFYANVPDAKYGDLNELKNLNILDNDKIVFRSSYAIQYFDTKKEAFINTFVKTKDSISNFPDGYVGYFACRGDYCYFVTQHTGLYQLNLKTGSIQNIPLPYNNTALTKIVIDDDMVWVGSYNGLIKYNTKTKVAKTYLQQDGLYNDFIVGLTISKSKMLWMVTASSVSCLNTKTDEIKNFYIKAGIGGGNSYGEKVMMDDNDNIVFGIKNYIGFIDKEILNEVAIPKKSIITELLVNNNDATWQIKEGEKNITLTSTENSISVHFTMEKAEENNTYFYKLNNDWRSLNSGRIELAGLASGRYKIYVSNQPKDNALNDFIIITIKPPFYKAWWFFILCVLGISAILYAFFKVRTNSIRKQTLLQKTYEQKLAESEMQTLRSQMNPHFMFNTLNSINSYIIQNKTALASEYLTTFSKLMRSILDLSKQETVPLAKEISALKMYIELEALRLENKFDYNIIIDKNVEEESIKIPSLIIQPFVENAIWHGLHNKNTQGHIDIHVKETVEHNLIITIEDDGIGRKASAAIKQEQVKHKSYGIDITLSRIKLLNEHNSVTFIDLYDKKNNATGTRVTIQLNTQYND
jgi:ligand-binding sensor domain-containing protein/two-component sensor histidine kinase